MSTELAAIGLRADASEVVSATDALHKFAAAADVADRAAAGFNDSAEGASDAAEDYAEAAEDATEATEELADQTEDINGSLNTLAARLGTVAGRLVAMATAALSVRAYQRMADAWSDMQSRIGAAIQDMSAAPEMMQRMVDVANASYAPLEQTVETYARNVSILKDLGVEAQGAADFTESLNHMLVITATKGERAASVQGALSKAMAVGKLQADGLETILASGGRVAEALAEELNTTVSGLRNMSSQSKITGTVIASALIGNLEKVREQAAEMPATIADGFTRIGTGVQAIVGSFDQLLQISGGVGLGLVAIGDRLKTIAETIASVTQQDLAGWFEKLTTVAEAFALVLLLIAATRVPALIVSLYGMVTALWAANTGVIGLRLALIALSVQGGLTAAALATLSFLGGPIGLVAAAIALIGVAAYKSHNAIKAMGDRANDTAVALKDLATEQSSFARATDRFYANMTASNLEYMRASAATAVELAERANKAAKAQLDNAIAAESPIFGITLYDTKEIAEARELVSQTAAAWIEAQAAADFASNTAANYNRQVAEGKIITEEATQAQKDALPPAYEMLQVMQNRIDLLNIAKAEEDNLGAASTAYRTIALAQERDIAFAKYDTLGVSQEMVGILQQTWMEEQTALGTTEAWDSAMNALKTSMEGAWTAAKNVAATEPGANWLDTAILKASTLWERLSAAAVAAASLDKYATLQSGSDERGSQRILANEYGTEKGLQHSKDRVAALAAAANKSGKGGKGGGGRGDKDTALETLTAEMAQRRELLGLVGKERDLKEEIFRLETSMKGLGLSDQRIEQLAKENLALKAQEDQLVSMAQTAREMGSTVANGLTQIFDGMVEGSVKAGDAIEGVIKKLISMSLQKSAFSLLGMAFPTLFGASGSMPLVKSANGNVFNGGSLVPFATGGIVNGPTAFPMSGGQTGLMGEAGPEAIIPLSRGADGKLGVKAQSDRSSGSSTNVFNINVSGARGNMEITEMVRAGIEQAQPALTKKAVASTRTQIRASKTFLGG